MNWEELDPEYNQVQYFLDVAKAKLKLWHARIPASMHYIIFRTLCQEYREALRQEKGSSYRVEILVRMKRVLNMYNAKK